MPLGDSITRGASDASNNIGDAGYRWLLQDALKKMGYQWTAPSGTDFDFVGSLTYRKYYCCGKF